MGDVFRIIRECNVQEATWCQATRLDVLTTGGKSLKLSDGKFDDPIACIDCAEGVRLRVGAVSLCEAEHVPMEQNEIQRGCT